MQHNNLFPLLIYYNSLDPEDSYHKACGILLQNMVHLSDMSIQETAERCLTSPATISRIAKKVGYKGFQELKECAKHFTTGYFNENRKLTIGQLKQGSPADIYLTQLIGLLSSLKELLGPEELAQATAMLNGANQIYCFGASMCVEQLQMDLFYVGKSVDVQPGFNAESIRHFAFQNSLVIMFDPGYPWFHTEEQLLFMLSKGAKVILISSLKREELEKAVDLTFHIPGTGTSMDEIFHYIIMTILSMEYRKRYIDSWCFTD